MPGVEPFFDTNVVLYALANDRWWATAVDPMGLEMLEKHR
jgi:hypothetical protein